MTEVVDLALSKQTTVTQLLQDRSPQALWTCLYYCLAPVLNHWMQRVRVQPELMLHFCNRFQTGLEEVARAALHPDIAKIPAVVDRIRLPARHGGLGLRDQTQVRFAAYLGCLNMVLPCMVNRLEEGGTLVRGFLHEVFGPVMAGKYNNESQRKG